MFYPTDMLCTRNRGKLSRIWLAATLNERLFKQSINNKILLSIRVDDVCDEILRILVSSGQQKMRFSLYLSSQLMYGVVKLLSYQTAIIQASLGKIQLELRHTESTQKKRGKRSSAHDEIDLLEPPALHEVFKNLHLQADIHLLPEADLETVRAGRTRAYVESPTFGALTDEQVDLFLTEDDWQLQTLADANLTELNEPIRYGADETEIRPISPPPPIEQEDFTTINAPEPVDTTINANVTLDATIKTPQKRASRMTDVDTPTKRRRRNLGAEMNAAAHRTSPTIPPVDFADQELRDAANVERNFPDQPNDQIRDDPMEISAQLEVAKLPEDDEIHLASLEMETPLRPKIRKARRVFIDEDTKLNHSEFARHVNNTFAHTIQKESVLVVPAGRRMTPATFLLMMPSTACRIDSESWRRNGFKYGNWAAELRPAFELRTIGPFTAENDHSLPAEMIRAADSRIQPMPQEISSGLERPTESSSRNKTTDDPSAEAINPPSIHPLLTSHDYQLPKDGVPLTDITNAPILEYTGDADTADVTNEPDFNAVPAVENIDEIGTNVVIQDLPSDPETGDIDAFLPPKLRHRSIVKKTSHEKEAAAEVIIEIPASPSSYRSDRCLVSEWIKPDLLTQLEVLWKNSNENQTVKLSDLVDPQHTTKLGAASCFTLLLELHKDRIVKLAQAEPHGEIHIYKAIAHRG